MRRSVLLVILLASTASAVAAQATPTQEPGIHISPALGVHYGVPLRFSGAAGVLVDMNGNRNDGIVAMAELGQQGYEISAGYFRMQGRFGSGYSLRAAVVRTAEDPWNATRKTTYVGVEGHLMIAFGVGGRVGYLRRASRSQTDPHENLASFGLSIGL
jgi:hypothetical protein